MEGAEKFEWSETADRDRNTCLEAAGSENDTRAVGEMMKRNFHRMRNSQRQERTVSFLRPLHNMQVCKEPIYQSLRL